MHETYIYICVYPSLQAHHHLRLLVSLEYLHRDNQVWAPLQDNLVQDNPDHHIWAPLHHRLPCSVDLLHHQAWEVNSLHQGGGKYIQDLLGHSFILLLQGALDLENHTLLLLVVQVLVAMVTLLPLVPLVPEWDPSNSNLGLELIQTRCQIQ